MYADATVLDSTVCVQLLRTILWNRKSRFLHREMDEVDDRRCHRSSQSTSAFMACMDDTDVYKSNGHSQSCRRPMHARDIIGTQRSAFMTWTSPIALTHTANASVIVL